MRIDNLCRAAPVQCGGCKDEQSLMRYLETEGWIPGTYTCKKCGYKRPIMAAPALLKNIGKAIRINQTQCEKCHHDFLTFKYKGAKA